jgi:hypothetical protein
MADERQVFVYKGVEYSLSSKLTPAEAKAKIQAHLGESTTQPKAAETPQEPQKSKGSTSLWEDIKLGLVGATEAAGKTAGAVGIAAMDKLGYKQEAEDLYSKIQKGSKNLRKWANPAEAEQGFGGKMVSGIIGMPSLPFQAPNTAMQFLEGGETLPRAYAAGGVDIASNIAGAFVPGGTTALGTAGKQFAAGAISDYISRGINSEIAQTKEVKRQFAPTIEDALVSGATGGLLGGLLHQPPKSKVKNPKLDTLKDIDAKKQAAKVEPVMEEPKSATSDFEAAALEEAMKRQRNAEQAAMLESAIARNEREGQRTAYDKGQSTETMYAGEDGIYTPDNMLVENAIREQDFTRTKQEAADAILAERQRALEQEVAQRTSLDQNAAERARQANAPTGFAEWQESLRRSAEAPRDSGPGPIDYVEGEGPPYGLGDTPYQYEGGVDYTPFNAEGLSRPVDVEGQVRDAWEQRNAERQGEQDRASLYEDRLNAEAEGLIPLEEQLRRNADRAPDNEQLRLERGRPVKAGTSSSYPNRRSGRFGGSQRGAIDPRVFEDLYNLGKSVVRGAEGLLMPLYHGSNNEITGDIRASREGGALGNGVYLAVRPEYASGYADGPGGNVHQVYADIRNPLKIDGPGDPMVRALETLGMSRDKAIATVEKAYDKKGYITTEVQNLARKQGYDGIFQYRNGKLSEIVAFDKDQVKNAISPEAVKSQKQSKPTRTMTEDEITGGWEEDTPSAPPSYNRFGQGGGQTILNDLGLGVYNTVTKGTAAAKRVLGKIKAGYIKDTEIPSDVPVEEILGNARSTPDTKAINALEAGNSMRGYKGRAQWVHDAGEYLLNRLKRSELNVRNYVTGNTGAEKFMRSLSRNEQIELAGLLKEEMLNRRQYDPADMAAAGFTAKQLEAYAKLRKMQEAALAALNYGRKVHNLPEITAQEAYLTSKWNGEIKMRVEDGEGKLVYYLAGNSERDVRNQFKALVKDNPGYKEGKIDRIKQTFNGSDVQKAYSIMADAIGRDNPEFQKIQDWYSQYQATQAHNSMGTRMHFEDKANIRGFVGDRPGYNPRTEAIALLQEQMNFAKESFHWAALQDAAVALSPIFQDPVIRDTQPNNLKYLQEQLAIAAGANEGAFSRGVNDGIRSLGFTPAQVFGSAQKAKSWFMFQKLSMNLGYGAANLLQLPFTMPHMIDIANKVGGFNPARSLAVAMTLGAPMAATHYSRQLGGIDLLQNIPDKNFYKSLMDYAEQNGVTSRSIVDEAPLDAGVIGRVGNFTTSAPETVIRSFAFTLFADSLKQTGKLSDMEVFKEAERRTNAALGDFRETQRAPIFSRMGNVGNILNTLQTFGINYYQQMNYFMRESLKGNWAPLAAMLAVQFGLSGISGMPGVQTAEKSWELVKGILPNNVWAKVGDFDPRIWAYEKFGATGVDGVLSTSTGVSFNSRIGAPAIEEMAQAPGGPIMEVGKQLLSAGQLAMKPEDKVQRAETAMKVLPAGFTGALETGPFRDQTSVDRQDGRMYFKSTDLNKRDAGYVRTPEEENLRRYGFRSTKEVTTRNLEWKQTKYKQELNERRRSFSDSFFDAVMKGDTKKASEIESNAIAVFGKSIVDNTMKTQIQQMYMTSYERAQADAGKLTPTELIRLKNIKSILDKYQ